MIDRANVHDYLLILKNTIRRLRQEVVAAEEREVVLEEAIRSLQRQKERDRLHMACFVRRHQNN